MSSHLSNEEWANFPAQAPGWATPTPEQRDWIDARLSEHVEAAERALVERIEAVLNDPDTNVTGWSGDWSYGEVLDLVAAIRAALAGDSSHSGTGEKP